MSYDGCHFERKKTLLEDEFYLRLDYADITHMRSLKTEAEVDQFVHQILVDRL